MKKLIYILTILCMMACQDKPKPEEQVIYDGPTSTMNDIDVTISEAALPKMRLIAQTLLVLNNDDQDFPDGIYIEFFDIDGKITSTLKADKGFYYAEEKYYTAEGHVLLKSRTSNDELSTELLNWVPKDQRIHTDRFVTITQDGEVLTGEGLEASQDFEDYTILKPSGTMLIEPAENGEDSLVNDGFDDSLEFEEDTAQYQYY